MIAESALLRWIPLLPFAGALVQAISLALLRRPLSRRGVISVSLTSVLGSLSLSALALAQLIRLGVKPGTAPMLNDLAYTWFGVGVDTSVFSADIAFQYDALSAVMCFLVTGIGAIVMGYSVGYMDADEREDRGFQRFFCYLCLFIGSMLTLVLADNFVLLFLGWELAGVCSALLIGFWYSDGEYARAGTYSLLVNRLGDFAFLVAVGLLFWALVDVETAGSSLAFRSVSASFASVGSQVLSLPGWLGGGEWSLASVLASCFLVAACARSAQGPLLVWLPSAMAGPVPASALVHSATFVAAGVYLVCRLAFVFDAAPDVARVMAWIGAVTALFGAVVALAQTDIKRVLAYSTMSQLGMMFAAAGCGAYAIAILHLAMHAFAKTLLMLGVGSLIVACRHECDMRRLGGLWEPLPATHRCMLVGLLVLCGLPFTNEQVLLATLGSTLAGHEWLYRVLLAVVFLTALYSFRLYFMTFHGRMRLEIARSRVNEPVGWMRIALYVMSGVAMLAGLLTPPQFWGDVMGIKASDSLGNFLSAVLPAAKGREAEVGIETRAIAASLVALFSGVALAYLLFLQRPSLVTRVSGAFSGLERFVGDGFRLEAAYAAAIVRPLERVSRTLLEGGVERGLVQGVLVNGTARSLRGFAAHVLKYAHSGYAHGYFAMMIIGLVLTFMLMTRSQ